MAFQLLATAEQRWRRINAPQSVPQVRAGAVFEDGRMVDRTGRKAA
jgi:hypothetical protein